MISQDLNQNLWSKHKETDLRKGVGAKREPRQQYVYADTLHKKTAIPSPRVLNERKKCWQRLAYLRALQSQPNKCIRYCTHTDKCVRVCACVRCHAHAHTYAPNIIQFAVIATLKFSTGAHGVCATFSTRLLPCARSASLLRVDCHT